jgi:hypothetical protein
VYLGGDYFNCGACGHSCGTGQACYYGACYSVCPPDRSWFCNGACVNLLHDAQSCGTCGNACAAGQTCSGGTCR